MDHVSVAVPYYGPQEIGFSAHLAVLLASLHLQDIELHDFIPMGSMAADHNRNNIVEQFLKSDVPWLFWIDSDMEIPNGAVRRLLNIRKTMVSGLYYGKNKPHPAIAYYRDKNGAYNSIDDAGAWERGEIIPVDAAGFGCMLTHRSVFEDIKANFTVLQRSSGGIFAVHNADIGGVVDDRSNGKPPNLHPYAKKVRKSTYYEPVFKPTLAKYPWPFFALEYGRTEDMYFFDLAHRIGHKPWIDTSVECNHIRSVPFTGADWRKYKMDNLKKQIEELEIESLRDRA